MGMKEEEKDGVGFTGAGATSSCLYFLLFHRLSRTANPRPFLIKLFPNDMKVMEFVTPDWGGQGWARGKSQSHHQLHIRSECLPGKSELPWKSGLSSPDNSGIYSGKRPQI